MGSAHNELIRLLGEENLHAVRIGNVNYYEITMQAPPPPIDAQWSNEVPPDHPDHENQFADDEHDKPNFKADRVQMYLDLLKKLEIDSRNYSQHINKDRLLLKIEDVESARAIGMLKMLADDHEKEDHQRDPKLKIAYLDRLLEAQEAGHVDAEPFLATPTDTHAETAHKLGMITCCNWKKIDTEAGPAYQTMTEVADMRNAATMLSEVFVDGNFRAKFEHKTGKLTIPHSQISQKDLHGCDQDLRDYFHPPAAVRKV